MILIKLYEYNSIIVLDLAYIANSVVVSFVLIGVCVCVCVYIYLYDVMCV